jgi:iron complex outermembrane receptor protein
MAEHSNIADDNLAPRLMFNWHLQPGQTLRFGVSRAFRPPSSFEKYSDVAYAYNGIPLQITTRSRGQVAPEYVTASELGYLGLFPALGGLELDVRVFNERVEGFVRRQRYALPVGSTLLPSTPWDYVNDEDFTIQGAEYQLKLRPWHGAELMLNQAYTTNNSRDPGTQLAAPRWASSVVLFQKLPRDLDLSLIYQNHSTETLQGSGAQFAMNRLDLRLAASLRLGATKGEVALVVQNLGSAYHDFDPLFLYKRRAFVSLTLEN